MKTRRTQAESIMDFYKVKLRLAEANHAKSFAVNSNVNYCLYTAELYHNTDTHYV